MRGWDQFVNGLQRMRDRAKDHPALYREARDEMKATGFRSTFAEGASIWKRTAWPTGHATLRGPSDSVFRSMDAEAMSDRMRAGSTHVGARAHRFGATITPKKGKFLRFRGAGGWIFARSVTLPPRDILRFTASTLKAISQRWARRIRGV